MKQKITYGFLFFSLAFQLSAQVSEDDVLAKVGNKEITVREFKTRYEMTPQVGRHVKNREGYLKSELLYSIIAEKLWALEAESLKLDTSNIMSLTFPALEKMHWRDELYTEEIKSKVQLSTEDYSKARQRSAYILMTHFLYAENEREIDSLYNILQNGFPFDSLLILRPEYAVQDSPYTVKFGQMEEYAEDSLYTLTPGEYTSPIKSPEGWYIFKLERVEPVSITNDREARNLEKEIRKTLESRKRGEIYSKYFNSFFKDKKIDADGEVFWSFADAVIKTLNKRAAKINPQPGETIHLQSDDFPLILSEIASDTLDMEFIKFESGGVTLREFLHDFFFEGFFTDTLNPDIIRAKLNSRVKYFIERELLAHEAKKRGLDKNEEVELFVDMWRDNYLSNLAKNKLLKEVKITDGDLLERYEEMQNKKGLQTQVNIVEVLTNNLDTVEKILNELDEGKELKDIAGNYTEREWTKSTNGEFGFFPVSMYGEIGRIAGELEVGEIYGPLKVDEGYSIFQVIGKKEKSEEELKPFNEVKNEIEKKLRGELVSDKLINTTVDLANKYSVSVNENLLKQVKVTNLSILVYRYYGFGGRTLAVPLTPPFIEWVDKWKESSDTLP